MSSAFQQVWELLKAEMSMAERTLHPGDSVAGWAERNRPDDFAASGGFFDDENSRIDWDEPSDKSTSPAFPVNFSPKEATDPAFKPVIEEMQRRLGSDLDWFQNKRGMEEEFREAYVNSVNPWGDDFPMTAREVGNVDLGNVDLGNVDLDTVPPLNQYPHIRSRKGRYFTKLPVHGVADKDKDRGTVDDEFSFQGVPFNEETHFTTGEPMDIPWRLLKFEESYGIPPRRPGESISDYMSRMGSIHMDSTPTPFRPLTERDFTPYVQRPQESNFDEAWQQKNAGEPMDIAMQLLKATNVSPPQWGKTFREEGFDEEGVYFPKEDESWIHPSNIYQAWKNGDFTPTVWGEGKEGQGRKDLSMINRLLGVDAHEDTHRAMSQIGEEYESGLHEEYAPMLSQNLIEARNPEGLQSQDYRQKLMGGGMSPEQAAIEATKLGAKFGFGHPAVREPPESSISEKPEDIKFYTGYGKNAGEPMDIAWQLLKAPIVESIPGVKVGYQAGGGLDQSAIMPEQVIFGGRAEEEIGNVPYASNAKSRMAMMTPNEYFDTISPYTDVPIQGGRDDDYRWAPRGQSSRDNIDRIIQGLKEGKMIGAPTLGYGGKPGFGYEDTENEDAWGHTGSQEGGHRMEALRQMGYGERRIPVLQQRNFHIPPAEKRKTPSPSRDSAFYRWLAEEGDLSALRVETLYGLPTQGRWDEINRYLGERE